MNTFVVFAICVFIFPILIASYLHVTTIDDLALNKDDQLYAGKGEVCVTPYAKINCEEGLKCVLTSTTPHINGICMPDGTKFEEDYVNRYENIMKNESLTDEYVYGSTSN